MIPKKLQTGDEIRIVAPAMSLGIISQEVRKLAIKRLEDMGLKVSFSKHVEEINDFASSSIESRIEDLHSAFRDKNVKGILSVIGGYNSNQLLPYLDYNLIKENPKFFCGYSDITALQNAFYSKSGLVSYSGPHFSTFGCLKGIEPVIEYFKNCLFDTNSLSITPSAQWSDDPWYLDQQNRTFSDGEGFWVIQKGEAHGTILGGNLSTLNLLQGTEYFPDFNQSILFLEEDNLANAKIFDQHLQSLIHQKNFAQVRGIVLGRFERKSEISRRILEQIISSKKELSKLPILANVDFGHTLPMFTFPIGGKAILKAGEKQITLKISD